MMRGAAVVTCPSVAAEAKLRCSATLREKFLPTYKLPSSLNTHDLFAPTVLALVNIVQVALALFDLGPVGRRMNVPDGLRA